MKGKKILYTLIIIALFPVLTGCTGKKEPLPSGKTAVFVSILPQQYFADRVGGVRVTTSVMVMPGRSPETYEPSPKQMIELGKASVFFAADVPFEEAFLPSVRKMNPSLLIKDTSEGITKRMMAGHGHEHESLTPEEGHEDENTDKHAEGEDPHTWLSPPLAAVHAENICAALKEIDPDGAEYYDANLLTLKNELLKLDADIESRLAPFRGDTFFVYHPAFGYFADRYGLVQESVETGGKEPTPRILDLIIKQAIEEKVKVIIVQPEFPDKSASAVAGMIGGTVARVSSLEYDYMKNIENICAAIESGLAGKE
ncbi:MAG: zinc ABC transporter substrate-binding protein [Spirochaetia bacterium]|jgi:zinc transport system substrate-binding protein|nr:zinc ABC transporter substrate-binding protein [Spirochaetia bacterium]